MLVGMYTLENENACIIRENIDSKHLVLHVHHKVVIVLKTLQEVQGDTPQIVTVARETYVLSH